MGISGTWLIDKFFGGFSEGPKIGIAGSFRNGQGLNFRDNPDVITANRALTLDSDTTVDQLVKWIVDYGTDNYMLGDGGDIYKRTSAGTYSLIGNLANSSGQGLAIFDDYLFATDDDGIHRYGPLSDTPTLQEDFLVSAANEIDVYATSSGNTYTTPAAIDEGATHKLTLSPSGSNTTGMTFNINAKGTGDWTLTIHDSSNAVLATLTIANASLPSSGLVRFEFTGIYDYADAETYHAHLTSSVADGTVVTGTSSDFSTAQYALLQEYLTEDVDQEVDVLSTVNETDTYTLPTSISEVSTAKQEFEPDKGNLLAVSVIPYAKGTGDWTLTVHDAKDNEIASKTLTSANVKQGKGYIKFEFASAVNVVPTATYHFHLTVSTGTSTVLTGTASDLNTAGYRTHYQILQTDDDWHPAIYFPAAQSLCIGNGNYLAVYDNIIYREDGPNTGSEKLQFSKEEKVRALELVGDRLVIGTWKGDSIGDHGESTLYFWDGAAAGYTEFKKLSGELNAILTGLDGLLYVWHGGNGMISIFDGSFTLVKTIPGVGENKTVEIYPGAVDNWNGIPYFGISDGSSTSVQRGVWSYGTFNKNFPRALNFDFPISAGDIDNGVQIGAIKGLGPSKLFIAWQNDTNYGVDIIDTANDQASVVYESRVNDGDRPDLEKTARNIKVIFEPLIEGQSITVKYKKDQETSWQDGGSTSTAGHSILSISLDITYHELELQVTLATTVADSPVVKSISTYYVTMNTQQEESR